MGKSTSHALPPLDEKDRHVLFELGQDCSRSLEEIAKRTGLSKQTLHYRIQRLADEGVIAGFIAEIDAAKLGYAVYRAWIQLVPLDEAKKKRLIDSLVAHEYVQRVASCEGKFDLVIDVLAENPVNFNSIFSEFLERFPGNVKNYRLILPFEEPKRAGLGEVDVKILNSLSKNARMPTIDLAKSAGVSPNTVRQRVGKLESWGVIRKYTVLVQPSKIGIRSYTLLVETQNMDEKDENSIKSFCHSNGQVASLRKMIGRWDMEIAIETKGDSQFQDFIIDFRSRFSNVIKEFEYVPIRYVHKMNYLPLKKA